MTNPTQLIYLLAWLYNTPDEIRALINNAGLKTYLPFIGFHYKASVFWSNIIFYLEEKQQLPKIIEAALNNGNQDNEYLKALLADPNTLFKSPYCNTRVDKPVNVDKSQLEKLTQGSNTLLPIHFLEKGLLKSKPVVRIQTSSSMGSGFIIQNRYLLTNNHVLENVEIAKTATIRFNYQENSSGAFLKVAKRMASEQPLSWKPTGFRMHPIKKNFPSSLLEPGKLFKTTSVYRFSVNQ